METIALCGLFGLFIIVSYTLGLKNGQKLKNEEKIETPLTEPINKVSEKIKENNIKKSLIKEQEIMEVNLANIENYDGTEFGQKEIPR